MSENKSKKRNLVDFIKTNKGFQKFVVVALSILFVIVFLFATFRSDSLNTETVTNVDEYVSSLEKKLTNALKKVEGVGDVSVVINVASGNETVLASKVTTTEKDGIKETEETPVIINGKTVVLKEKYPEIIGVLIVAEGSRNIAVRYKIEKATSSLLKIDVDRIEILSMN